jgi:hypothetical protein
VRIDVRDALGRTVLTPVNAQHMPGAYAVDIATAALGTGIYFAVLQTNGVIRSRPLGVVR